MFVVQSFITWIVKELRFWLYEVFEGQDIGTKLKVLLAFM